MSDTQTPDNELTREIKELGKVAGVELTHKTSMAELELRATAALFTHEELAILFIDAQSRYRDAKSLLNKIKRMQHIKADNETT